MAVRCPKPALSFPIFFWEEQRKCDERLMFQDKKRQRSLTNYSHKQNRLHLEVNLLPIKSHSMIMRNKTQILKQLLLPLFLFFLVSTSLSVLLPLSSKWHMRMRNGSCHYTFLCPHTLPCSSVESL